VIGDDERQGGEGDTKVQEQEAVALVDEGAIGDPDVVRRGWAVVVVSKTEGACEIQGGGWCALRGLKPQPRDHNGVSEVCWQCGGRGQGKPVGAWSDVWTLTLKPYRVVGILGQTG
jgi:hypothetical protein